MTLASLRATAAEADQAAERARASLATAQAAVADGNAAQAELVALDTAGDSGVEHARGALTDARARKAAFEAKALADKLHVSIARGAALIALLAPEGLRQACLARALAGFNAALKRLCDMAGWAAVEIDRDLTLAYGGRPYGLCCGNERFRIRAAAQVAMAESDGSAMLIFDPDIDLDRLSRQGTAAMVMAAGKQALICMVKNDRADIVPLPDGMGATYWVENGIAERMT